MEVLTNMVAQAMNSVAGELIAIQVVIFLWYHNRLGHVCGSRG